MRRKILFLCTGNSARSQMAEGLVNHFLGDEWEAYSAGTAPAGYVHPLAVKAMAELGIDISAQRSKSVGEFRDAQFDLVITVCDQAAQNCPLWLGSELVKHTWASPTQRQPPAVRTSERKCFGRCGMTSAKRCLAVWRKWIAQWLEIVKLDFVAILCDNVVQVPGAGR
jgi:arsenate reductase